MSKEFYVQNVAQGYVGNSMLWWKQDDHGYTCDLRGAKVFTLSKIAKMDSIRDGTKRAWPKAYIDARVEHHIDMQDCDNSEAWKKDSPQ